VHKTTSLSVYKQLLTLSSYPTYMYVNALQADVHIHRGTVGSSEIIQCRIVIAAENNKNG